MRCCPSNVGLVPIEIAAGQRCSSAAAGVQAGQPARVDTVGGDGGMRQRFQVRGGEAERPAAPVAADHDALHPVRAAQVLGGTGHVPLVQTTNVGAFMEYGNS